MLAGAVFYQYFGEYEAPHGPLGAGYAYLSSSYALDAYLALVVAVSSYCFFVQLGAAAKAVLGKKTSLGRVARLYLLPILGCLCFVLVGARFRGMQTAGVYDRSAVTAIDGDSA